MRTLALDLATSTGFACGGYDAPISHGILRLPRTGEDLGRFLSAFREWLGHAIEEMAPTDIIFEMPILPAAMSLMAVRKLNGLCGVAELVALDYKISIREANLLDIRKHFIGVTRAPKTITTPELRRRWLKDLTVEQCRKRGFRVAGDDDADAIALLSYALQLKRPNFFLQAVTEKAAA